MPPSEISRRTILKVSLGLSGLLTVTGLARFLGYPPSPSTPTRFTLQAPNDYPIGSVTSIAAARVWLLRDEAGLYALSAICTHLGCTVNYAGPQFQCPCHGSQFDRAGNVLRGPATRPLQHVELSLSPTGLLVVDTSKVVPADQQLPVSDD